MSSFFFGRTPQKRRLLLRRGDPSRKKSREIGRPHAAGGQGDIAFFRDACYDKIVIKPKRR